MEASNILTKACSVPVKLLIWNSKLLDLQFRNRNSVKFHQNISFDMTDAKHASWKKTFNIATADIIFSAASS